MVKHRGHKLREAYISKMNIYKIAFCQDTMSLEFLILLEGINLFSNLRSITMLL